MDEILKNQLEKIGENANELEKMFEDYQQLWRERVKVLFPMLKDFNKMIEAQIKYLSYRHQVSDVMFKHMASLTKKYDTKRQFEKILSHSLKNLKASDQKKEISIILSKLTKQIELTEIWIEFCKNLINTLDKMSYSFKYRIDIEKMK